MKDFFVPKDLLLFSNNMGMNSDFSVRGFSGGLSEAMATLTVPEPWTPADITTALWLDAADDTTFTLDSNSVREWRDKSGNANHAGQTTTAYKPTKVGSIVTFSTDHMTIPDDATLQFGTGDFCIISVFKSTKSTGYQCYINKNYVNGFEQWISGQNFGAFFGNSSPPNTPTALVSTTHIGMSCRMSGSAFYRLNGTETTPGANTNSVSGIGTNVTIGARPGDSTSYLLGSLSEIIILPSGFTAADMQKIEGYLAHKWDLEASLPSDHPYKSAPPTI